MSRSVESYEASEFMRNELAKVRAINGELLKALSLLLLETEDYPELMPQTLVACRAAIAKATGSAK